MKQFVKARTQLQSLLSDNNSELSVMDKRKIDLESENVQIKQILDTPFMKSVNLDK